MKKRITFALVAMMLAALLCACGTSNTEETTAPSIMLSTESAETTAATTAPEEETVPTETTIPEETTEPSTEPTAAETEPAETTVQHSHSYTKSVVAATCTAKGYTLNKCKTCTYSYKSNQTAALGHSYKEEVVAPTTSAEGYTLHTCKTCGYSYKDNYKNKLDSNTGNTNTGNNNSNHTHSYSSSVTAATCTKKGYTTYKCSCGYSYKANETAAKGHNYKESVTAPTCAQYGEGYTTYTCKTCNYSYKGNYTNALEHNMVEDGPKAPTCTQYGVNMTYHCTKCGFENFDYLIDPIGHTWGEWVRTKEPTTSVTGVDTRTCSVCKKTETRSVDKLPAAHEHNYTSKVTAPTCTTKGYTTYTCACGNSYNGNETNATGHTWGEWTRTKEPTASETGVDTRTCNTCRATETRSVDKLPAAHVHDYASSVTAPTCTANGYTTHTCACGDSYTDNETDATGHTWGEWTRTKEPTTSETGVETRTCACGASETRSVDKLPEETQPSTPSIDTSSSYAVSEVVDIINQYRAEAGLPALSYYSAGQEVANVRAAEIRVNFSHTRPDGSDSYDYTSQYGLYGECITGGANNAQDVVDGWMSSDAHRNQIMADFFTCAVVARNGSGWVILLG